MEFEPKINDIIASAIGPFEVLHDHRKDSVRTGVVEVLSEGNRYFVKIHNRLSRWNPEVYAYKHWTKPCGKFCPSLVEAFNDGDIFGIIITAIEGRTVNEMRITDDEKLVKIYYEAGRLFRKMETCAYGTFLGIPKEDGSPYDANVTTDPVASVADFIEAKSKWAYDNGLLDDSFKPLIDWSLKNSVIFKDEIPVPTNWDFSPQNWMADADGNFTGFIDFENMVWGIPLDSFGVITDRYTFDKPHLLKSLFEGYGLSSDEMTQQKLNILRVKMAVADVCNGHSFKIPRFTECGIRMLQNLRDTCT